MNSINERKTPLKLIVGNTHKKDNSEDLDEENNWKPSLYRNDLRQRRKNNYYRGRNDINK
jgi:hypothetical protein